MNIFEKMFNGKKTSSKALHPFNDLIDMFLKNKTNNLSINSYEDIYEKITWANRCVSVIAEKTASIDLFIYNDKNKQTIHPKLQAIFDNPSLNRTRMEFFDAIITWKKVRGFAAIEINYPKMEVLDSDRVLVEGRNLYYLEPDGSRRMLDMKKVAILKNKGYRNNTFGMPQLLSLLPTAKLQAMMENTNYSVLNNGAILPYMLSTDEYLAPNVIAGIKKQFEENYVGVDNAGNVPILHSGLKPINIGVSPLEMGLLNQENITKQRIATVFGVPSILLNDMQNVNYATAKIQQEIFIRTTIMTECTLLKQQLTKHVLPLLGLYGDIYFDFSNLPELREDELQKAQARAIYLTNGVVTINEIRTEDGLEPVEWGDEWWRQFSLTNGSDMTSYDTISSNPDSSTDSNPKAYSEPQVIIKKNMNAEDRALYWKMYVSKTFSQEMKMSSEIRKYFARQRKEVLSSVSGKAYELPGKWEEIIYKTLKPLYFAFGQQAADSMIEDYGLGITFDIGSARIANNIEASLAKTSSELIKTTNGMLDKELSEGISKGETVDQLAQRINKVYDFSEKYRSKRIARTEVNGVNNMTMLQVGTEAGMQKKIWSAAIDEKTRPGHLAVDGMSIPIDQKFEVPSDYGYDMMDSPGDRMASAANLVNCRCVVVFE